ncbi:F-box protein SKIP24 isoform X1 [Carya illinoinensis]|uniref:F-box protein SKIP24 isoform X1 n=1 Tax=Carya illinoinensis TaxID=32201 RepID=UPI001C71A270|nr:F-box protein SKIP24 isoform X1 [Carya illinoinensis]XP_042940730.1 F-box protein SKIP24 isoform X1 [Carya illinoinensis]
MSILPDELWRRILELGITSRCFTYKDLCCISISCRRLLRISDEDWLWSRLLFFDFPSDHRDPPSSSFPSSSLNNSKSLYRSRYERDRERKFAAHKRAVLRKESQIAEHSRKLRGLETRLAEETDNMRATISELSNLRKAVDVVWVVAVAVMLSFWPFRYVVSRCFGGFCGGTVEVFWEVVSREASVALKVWQPEVIRGRQKQIVEQCVVPVESRIRALEMELKLCKQQILGFEKALKDEKQRLNIAKEELLAVKYHPLRDYTSLSNGDHESNKKKKNKELKRSQ